MANEIIRHEEVTRPQISFRRGMRPRDKRVSRLLPIGLSSSISPIPSLRCRCVNSPFNLKRLVYKREDGFAKPQRFDFKKMEFVG